MPYHIIEDKQPDAFLLNEHHQPSRLGDIPISLTKDVSLCFHLIPNNDLMTGIRLRIGTYCRINDCHLTVHINDFKERFNAQDFVDNEYVTLLFSKAQTCVAGESVEIQLYSEDTTENHVFAVWCSNIAHPFFNRISAHPIVFPQESAPKVSIIIPVFNKILYTYNCLLTVQACDPEISKEVIIINNASSDETATVLSQLQGAVHIINNQENNGFVKACRQGAESAKGAFILFLNNDTQVTPGWLSNMLTLMETHPNIGITGSKLIYPDGRLQEAGGIIFSDASGWNYGRLQSPTEDRFNQSREVDYCSGASLMIRTSLWTQLGGFDMRYAPAYYEDTDLCFATRQAGYQVFYCHNSEVIHHEGITSGTDIQSGYKAYQAINQKKFQAKWWHVLSTNHPPPPPQSSPDVAAFRFMTDDHHTGFRIPKNKILATHFLAQGWAANFWSYLNLTKIEEELEFIQSIGFNTVILLVPWVGFQTKVDPITYYEDYFTLLQQLLDTLQKHDLYVILRLGYTHDNGPYSEPEGFLRQVVVGEDTVMLAAWCDYLDRIWELVHSYPNVLGGFLTWEDFFFMDLTHIPLKQRFLLAERTGYQKYLEKKYSLKEISDRYQQSFSNYTDVPIPAFKSRAIHLFSEFWDTILIETIFTTSKKHFPRLSMEVRTDCDPQENTHICHHNTFNLTSDADTSMVYYTPAYGAPNEGQAEPVENISTRMQWMFEQIHTHTHNTIFIDQFNFIDNTPGFEQNTRLLAHDIPRFLSDITPILQKNTIGYGLWTLRDVRANALKNGLFERNYPSWNIDKGQIIFDAKSGKKVASLNKGGTLRQLLAECSGVPLVKKMPFQLDFILKTEQKVSEPVLLRVCVLYENAMMYDHIISFEQAEDWQDIHLDNIPFSMGYTLVLENKGSTVLLGDFYLYQLCQENGIIDVNNQPKSFFKDIVLLNQNLNTPEKRPPPSFFHSKEITPQQFEGVFSDHWMRQTLRGIIAKPSTTEPLYFVIKAYIPDTWTDYNNQITLTLDEKQYRATLKTAYNEICLGPLEPIMDDIVFFQLHTKTVVSPHHYDKHSQDIREVSMLLIEFGIVTHCSISS